MEEIEGGGKRGNIPSNVCETTGTRSLEAVCWYCVSDLFHGNVREDEFVSIGVEQLSVGSFQVEQIGGFERRQRGGRG